MMNERIRELAEQAEAHYRANVLGASMYKTPPNRLMEKFAELIVQECIDCLNPLSRNHSMVGAAQDTIKEHFGVE